MQVAAASLSDSEMRILARHFASMPGLNHRPLPQHPLITNGDPARQLPSCVSCHAPGKAQPILTGQKAHYIAARLRQWRGDDKIVDARKPQQTMAVIARRIPEDQIDTLARLFEQAGHEPDASPSPDQPVK